jgi:hypothetical protein
MAAPPRATTMETGLFEIEHPGFRDLAHACFVAPLLARIQSDPASGEPHLAMSAAFHCPKGLSPSTPCRSPRAHWVRFGKTGYAQRS